MVTWSRYVWGCAQNSDIPLFLGTNLLSSPSENHRDRPMVTVLSLCDTDPRLDDPGVNI